MLRTFRKALRLVGERTSARWIVLGALATLVSLLEMLGALLIFVLLGLIAEPGTGLALPLVGDVRRGSAGGSDEAFLLWVAAALGVFFLVRAVVQVGFAYAKHRLAKNAAARISTRLVTGYLRMPYAFHLRRNSAELVRNIQQTADRLADECFLPLIYVIADGIIVLGLTVVLVAIAPLATALAVGIVGGAALALLWIVQPRLRRLGAKAHDLQRCTQETLQQSLHGVRDIKVLRAEDAFARIYAHDRFGFARASYTFGATTELPRAVIETALLGFILALFAISVAAGTQSQELLATLGLFAYAGLRLQTSVQKIVGGLNSIKYSQAALDQVYTDLALIESTVTDRATNGRALTFHRELRLDDVCFNYEGTDRLALHDVSLVIHPGEAVGICGPTGGGKTTLTDLIAGVLEPTGGRISIDGLDLRLGTPAWYQKVGVVPQMVFLMDDTLRRNIALGVPDDRIDEAALIEAVRLAQLGTFVDTLPLGLDTTVGERGIRLSGGQRQRVAIARALYRRPEVLIFDEGTSALDTSTESDLISSLERLRGRHTIIMVAHRLSTVRNCDRIVYVADGTIQGVGTYDALVVENAGFRALARDA